MDMNWSKGAAWLLCAGWLLCTASLMGCGDFVSYDEGASPPHAGDAAVADCPFSPASTQLDYGAYDALLSEVVRVDDAGDARVDYDALQADGRPTLEALLLVMACADPQPGDLSFWLNAYNASVLRAVLSARADDPAFGPDAAGFALFSERIHRVAGLLLTLDELEHGIIRGEPGAAAPDPAALMQQHQRLWEGRVVDARIHMALNCAARSCPNLGASPYALDRLDSQLTEATRFFLANPEKGAGPDGVSALFDWYGDDFAASAGSVEDFIDTWRMGGLQGVDAGTFLEYDWALNAQ